LTVVEVVTLAVVLVVELDVVAGRDVDVVDVVDELVPPVTDVVDVVGPEGAPVVPCFCLSSWRPTGTSCVVTTSRSSVVRVLTRAWISAPLRSPRRSSWSWRRISVILRLPSGVSRTLPPVVRTPSSNRSSQIPRS